MKHALQRYTCALILVLAHAATAWGQVVENDLRLVADQSGAAPNVMILFDTSGSMRHIIWDEGFNPKIGYQNGASCTAITVDAKSGTTGQCPGSGLSGDSCPNNDNFEYSGTQFRCSVGDFPNLCSGWNSFSDPNFTDELCFTTSKYIYFTIPSINNQETWWSENYLNYLVLYMRNNGSLPPNMPAESRTSGGKRVIEELVNAVNPDDSSSLGYEERVRFGLARLDPSSVGGYVVEPIADGNKTAIISTLQSLPASGGTPVSEALVDVGRYFVGQHGTLGTYPQYDRTTSGAINQSLAPSSPLDPAVLCRGNFLIIISDGDPTNDGHNHFSTEFNQTFGNDYDGDGNTSISTDALDDVALYLFQNDLVDDSIMPGDQQIITYTVGYALDTQLLADTAFNGDGAYFTVSTTEQLAATLTATIEEIILRNATFTAASVPTSRSVFGDGFYTAFFEPRPSGELYVGHLQAYRLDENFSIVGNDGQSALDPTTGEFLEPRDTYFWDARETLLDPNNARNIFFTPTPTSDPNSFVAANIDANDLGLVAADLTAYPNDPTVPFANTEALADAIVNFVRGQDAFDADRDSNTTELRSAVLGDIFHSNPQVVGPAPLVLAAEDGYGPLNDPNSFVVKYATREKIIYAGANDGMLHAFGAGVFKTGDNPSTPNITENDYYTVGDGIERFGYIPGFFLDDLKRLPLTGAKPYFVDGQITIGDAWFPSGSTDTAKVTDEWTTVLIAGLRNGGRGYFALDVTDPQAATAANPHGPYPKRLWELDETTEALLGRSWSKAIITRVKLEGSFSDDFCGLSDGDGANGGPNGNCREEWVAIFGGGYLEQADPNISDQFISDPSDPNWDAASKGIFMVSLDTGQVLSRVVYDANDAELANMTFAFPSEPAVLDIDFDGYADLVYIGDTGGQMWKWDISESGKVLASTNRVPLSDWPAKRFFVAPMASNGHRRNFFFPPSASLVEGDLVLAFGTGERTFLDYESTDGIDENQFYVVRDDTPKGAGAFSNMPFTISDLTEVTNELNDPDTSDQGFFFTGGEDEKFVADSIVFGGFVITASYTPDLGAATTNGGLCEARGDATLYIFQISDGSGYFSDEATPSSQRRLVVGSGLPTSPNITVVSGNMSKVVLQTSDGRVITLDGPPSSSQPVDLVYWRQAE